MSGNVILLSSLLAISVMLIVVMSLKIRTMKRSTNKLLSKYIDTSVTAASLRAKYYNSTELKAEDYRKRQDFLQLEIEGQIRCNRGRLESAASRGETQVEITRNCCINEHGVKRYRELGYKVTSREGKEGESKVVYIISWA